MFAYPPKPQIPPFFIIYAKQGETVESIEAQIKKYFIIHYQNVEQEVLSKIYPSQQQFNPQVSLENLESLNPQYMKFDQNIQKNSENVKKKKKSKNDGSEKLPQGVLVQKKDQQKQGNSKDVQKKQKDDKNNENIETKIEVQEESPDLQQPMIPQFNPKQQIMMPPPPFLPNDPLALQKLQQQQLPPGLQQPPHMLLPPYMQMGGPMQPFPMYPHPFPGNQDSSEVDEESEEVDEKILKQKQKQLEYQQQIRIFQNAGNPLENQGISIAEQMQQNLTKEQKYDQQMIQMQKQLSSSSAKKQSSSQQQLLLIDEKQKQNLSEKKVGMISQNNLKQQQQQQQSEQKIVNSSTEVSNISSDNKNENVERNTADNNSSPQLQQQSSQTQQSKSQSSDLLDLDKQQQKSLKNNQFEIQKNKAINNPEANNNNMDKIDEESLQVQQKMEFIQNNFEGQGLDEEEEQYDGEGGDPLKQQSSTASQRQKSQRKSINHPKNYRTQEKIEYQSMFAPQIQQQQQQRQMMNSQSQEKIEQPSILDIESVKKQYESQKNNTHKRNLPRYFKSFFCQFFNPLRKNKDIQLFKFAFGCYIQEKASTPYIQKIKADEENILKEFQKYLDYILKEKVPDKPDFLLKWKDYQDIWILRWNGQDQKTINQYLFTILCDYLLKTELDNYINSNKMISHKSKEQSDLIKNELREKKNNIIFLLNQPDEFKTFKLMMNSKNRMSGSKELGYC